MDRKPLRMCAVCRKRQPKEFLIRIVKTPNGENFLIDTDGKAQGRGAYVCKEEECLKKCVNKRLLNKSFKMQLPKELYDNLEQYKPEN